MAQTVDEAEEERDRQRRKLEESVDSLEARVKDTISFRERLAQDGARYVVLGLVTVAAVTAALALRRMSRKKRVTVPPPVLDPMDDLRVQVEELRNLLKHATVKEKRGLAKSLGLRLATAGGTAFGTLLAKRVFERVFESSEFPFDS